MANTTRPLTNTEIQTAKPREKEYNLSDGGGLALRIPPSGTKSWVFNYTKPFSKKRTNISFGLLRNVTLASARKKREVAREQLVNGIDPKEFALQSKQEQTLAHSNTLKAVAEKWLIVKSTTVTEDYADDIWRSLCLHVFPTLGSVPIHKVKAVITIEQLQPLADSRKLETLKRVIQRLNEIMTYSVNTGLIDANPLAGISKAFENPKKANLPSIKPEHLPELVSKIEAANIKHTTRQLILWQLHTMTRPSEAAGTRWEEIDFDSKVWNIPGERMKKKRPHSIPLSPQAIDILERMKPVSSNREHVFPADRKPTVSANSQTANMALKRMGYKDILVAHGLRSLASTTLNEHAFDPDLIETALAHVDKNEVRRAYNRAEYIEQRRVMMCWWSDRIESDTAASGNVLSIVR